MYLSSENKDRLKARLYWEYMDAHMQTYESDRQRYWAECTRKVEEKYRRLVEKIESGKKTFLEVMPVESKLERKVREQRLIEKARKQREKETIKEMEGREKQKRSWWKWGRDKEESETKS